MEKLAWTFASLPSTPFFFRERPDACLQPGSMGVVRWTGRVRGVQAGTPMTGWASVADRFTPEWVSPDGRCPSVGRICDIDRCRVWPVSDERPVSRLSPPCYNRWTVCVCVCVWILVPVTCLTCKPTLSTNDTVFPSSDNFKCTAVIMTALRSRCGHYIFALWFLSCFSSPDLSGRRLDVCHTSTHGVALVRI